MFVFVWATDLSVELAIHCDRPECCECLALSYRSNREINTFVNYLFTCLT